MDNSDGSLKRQLSARQLTMIAIGGAIGTGLFVASGNSIHSAGPGGTMVAYLITGLMVYFLMTSLGEMAAFMPTSGSFYTYGAHFVDPAFGFALGCNYWYNWAITVAAEIAAATYVMSYWFPHVASLYWSAIFLAIFFLLNYCSVKGFGEAEYWLSLIKVVTVVLFVIIGTVMILGWFGEPSPGLSNWTIGDAPFHGGWLLTLDAFLLAGYSFQGTELVGIAAGEAEDPSKSIPLAIRTVFWRILLFYVLAVLIISFLIPYNSPLLASTSVTVSPFTQVFTQSGIAHAASIMNFVILVAILSAGNSGLYASTRMLWYLAKQGHAPKIFARVDKRGVPVNALLITAAVGMLTFLSSIFGNGKVYFWLLNASGLSGFIAWLGIAISHYRFRRAYVAQGRDLNALPYRAKAFPLAPIFATLLCVFVIIAQNYTAFLAAHINWYGILVSYIGIPVFIALWLGYKMMHKTRVVRLQECQFDYD